MIRLLQIELKKIIPYSTFWVIFLLFIILTPIFFYSVGQIKLSGFPIDFTTMFQFPHVWNNITYIASWFNLLIGMCIVILTCNEFSFKTFRQHIIDGQSRVDLILSKIILIIIFALTSTLYLFVLGSFFGFLSGDGSQFLDEIKYLFIYCIQSIAYMSVALIIAISIRSTALSLIIFLFSIVIENIIQLFIPHPIDKYFPMEIISNLTPFPSPNGFIAEEMKKNLLQHEIPFNTTILIALVYIVIFLGISYLLLIKRDIK